MRWPWSRRSGPAEEPTGRHQLPGDRPDRQRLRRGRAARGRAGGGRAPPQPLRRLRGLSGAAARRDRGRPASSRRTRSRPRWRRSSVSPSGASAGRERVQVPPRRLGRPVHRLPWEPGCWVEADAVVPCEQGVHACRSRISRSGRTTSSGRSSSTGTSSGSGASSWRRADGSSAASTRGRRRRAQESRGHVGGPGTGPRRCAVRGTDASALCRGRGATCRPRTLLRRDLHRLLRGPSTRRARRAVTPSGPRRPTGSGH